MYDILCGPTTTQDKVEWIGFMSELDGAKEMARIYAGKWRGIVIYVQEQGKPEILYQCVVPT